MTLREKVLRKFFELGYYISKDGEIYNSNDMFLKGWISENYKYFSMRIDGCKSPKKVAIHRLQAYQKYGDNIFQKGIVVRHLNGNSLDNSWNNIDIGTQSDNMRDRSKEDLKNHAIKASKKRQDKIRTQEERYKIYEKLRNNTPYNAIIQENNISRGTLSFMKNKSYEYQEYIHNLSK